MKTNNLSVHQTKGDKALKILFLSKSGFVGKHMVRQCIERGHNITLFNRGKRKIKVVPDIEVINRDTDKNKVLKELEGRKWHAIVDMSGYVSKHVEGSISLLTKFAPHYLLISKTVIFSDDDPFDKKNCSPSMKPKPTGTNYPPHIHRPGNKVGPDAHTDIMPQDPIHPGYSISVKLIATESGTRVWSEVYDFSSFHAPLVDRATSEILDTLQEL